MHRAYRVHRTANQSPSIMCTTKCLRVPTPPTLRVRGRTLSYPLTLPSPRKRGEGIRLRRYVNLTHLDETGGAHMVDVAAKPETARLASASGFIRLAASTVRLLRNGAVPKGDVLAAARIAGIMAAKRTSGLPSSGLRAFRSTCISRTTAWQLPRMSARWARQAGHFVVHIILGDCFAVRCTLYALCTLLLHGPDLCVSEYVSTRSSPRQSRRSHRA